MAVTSRVTKSGQTTIPAEIRKRIGLKPGDTVIWGVNDRGRAEVEPVPYTLEELDGILPPLPGNQDLDDAIREAVAEGMSRKFKDFSPQ